MANSVKSSRWVAISGWMTVLGTVSAITWSFWDHVKPKPAASDPIGILSTVQPSVSVHGNYNKTISSVASGNENTVTGNGNIVNNSGTVTLTSGRTIPSSEKEAARQRLHDSGIEYSSDRFYSALQNHESDVVALFTEAGMTLKEMELIPFANSFYDSDVAKALLKGNQSSACPTGYNAFFYNGLEGSSLTFVQQICSNEAVRSRLKDTIQQAKGQVQGARENDKQNDARTMRDIASCENTMLQTFGPRVSRASAHEQCTYQIRPAPVQQTAAEVKVTQLEKALEVIEAK